MTQDFYLELTYMIQELYLELTCLIQELDLELTCFIQEFDLELTYMTRTLTWNVLTLPKDFTQELYYFTLIYITQ